MSQETVVKVIKKRRNAKRGERLLFDTTKLLPSHTGAYRMKQEKCILSSSR
jgi:hypothetical protein